MRIRDATALFGSLLFIFSVIAARPADAQISAAERALREQSLRRMYEPTPIDPPSIRAIARDLEIEDETAILDALAAYEAAWRPILEGPVQIVRERWPACFSIDRQRGEVRTRHTPELLLLLQARAEAFRAADVADEALFARLLAADREEDSEIDPVASTRRERRRRRRELLDLPDRLPGTSIEPMELVTTVAVDPEILEGVLPVLDEWEAELDAALVARWARSEAIERMRAASRIELGPEWRRLLTGVERDRADRELAAYEEALIAAEIPRRNINAEMIEALGPRVPPLTHLEIVRSHHRLAHPALFVEDARLDRLIREVLASDELDERGREDVENLIAATAERLNRLGVAAAKQADRSLESRYRHVSDAVPLQELGATPTLDDDIEAIVDEIELLDAVLERRREFDRLVRPFAGIGAKTERRVEGHRAVNASFDRRDRWSRDRLRDLLVELGLRREERDRGVDFDADRGIEE